MALVLFLTLLNGEICELGIAIKQFELRNGFDIVAYGKDCRSAPAFNFLSAPLGGAIT